jgi:hypothetical protein
MSRIPAVGIDVHGSRVRALDEQHHEAACVWSQFKNIEDKWQPGRLYRL